MAMSQLNQMDARPHKPALEREELRDIIILSLFAGQMLLQNGADSKRVEETVHRLGTGLGADWMDVVVLSDAIIASTVNSGEFRTKVRRAPGRGVNMQTIAEVTDLSYRLERGELDRFGLRSELHRIDQQGRNYNRWVVVVGVGFACASFSRLFGGDLPVFFVTWLAAAAAMFTRQELSHRHFNHLLIVVATAFVAGMIASVATVFTLSPDPSIALAASVLLLVPGVPLVNATEDMINGYYVTGITRGVLGILTSLGIALGLTIAMQIMGVPGL